MSILGRPEHNKRRIHRHARLQLGHPSIHVLPVRADVRVQGLQALGPVGNGVHGGDLQAVAVEVGRAVFGVLVGGLPGFQGGFEAVEGLLAVQGGGAEQGHLLHDAAPLNPGPINVGPERMKSRVSAALLRNPIHGDGTGPLPAQLLHLPEPLEAPVRVAVLEGHRAPPHAAGDPPGSQHMEPSPLAADLEVADRRPVQPGGRRRQPAPRQVQRVQRQRHHRHHPEGDHGEPQEVEEHEPVQAPLAQDIPVGDPEHGPPPEEGVREGAHLRLPRSKQQGELRPQPAKSPNQRQHEH
mmetsp:Transcript_19751/g.47987  ORF Transcript_19751/g.47987 Transcript_19751/m.47987 type:complete len:296 (-) Transcript_19751:333-1220(-)